MYLGETISWSSKLYDFVALLIIEVDHVAGTQAC